MPLILSLLLGLILVGCAFVIGVVTLSFYEAEREIKQLKVQRVPAESSRRRFSRP